MNRSDLPLGAAAPVTVCAMFGSKPHIDTAILVQPQNTPLYNYSAPKYSYVGVGVGL